jgi:hypothetical protein
LFELVPRFIDRFVAAWQHPQTDAGHVDVQAPWQMANAFIEF